MNPGFDYGMGQTNIDKETGIRYGIIVVHDLMSEAIHESLEADYGEPHCPKCGNEAKKGKPRGDKKYTWSRDGKGVCGDYHCVGCKYIFDGDEAFGDDPVAQVLDADGYKGFLDDSNDMWLTLSPYYTWAQFCSPCAPGAGHLGNPMPQDEGAKTYCFGHDWFDGGKAPYPVYSVKTNELIPPPENADAGLQPADQTGPA
jgi:hypothetical protein